MPGSTPDDHCQEPDCHRGRDARGWCAMHYKRWLRHGSPVRGVTLADCAVDGCDRASKSRGWCHAHYQRWRAHGDVRADVPLRAARPCAAEGCDRPSHAKGWCQTHYRRVLTTGDAREGHPIRIVTGNGWLSHGYWHVPVPEEDRWLVKGETSAAEHRYVKARQLGRPLADDEVVHHINGVRTDNRAQNLELWSTAHPKGQRIDDKVAFAVAFLRRYAPRLLCEDERPPPGAETKRSLP